MIIKRLRAMRQEAMLSQLALSKKLGYTVRTIQSWENGEKVPSLLAVEDYANAFGFTLTLKEIK